MTADLEIRHPSDNEREALSALRTVAFNASRPSEYDADLDRDWSPTPDRILAVYDGGRPVATCKWWQLGHWLGGRCVPTAGIGSVVVDTLYRGRGIATTMMRELLTQARDAGQAMTTLYPMNHGLYQRLGYGLGFHRPLQRFDARVLTSLPRPATDVKVRPSTDDDIEALSAVYDRIAQHEHGMLRREYRFAGRFVDNREKTSAFSYVSLRDGEVSGYATFHRSNVPGGYSYEVNAQVVAEDRDSLLTLWRIIAGEVPVVSSVSTVVGPGDPLLTLIPERCLRTDADSVWHPMTRVLDLPAAMAERGWPEHADGSVTLHLTDPLLDLSGSWELTVRGGVGHAERIADADRPGITLSINALSSIFTSFADPVAYARAGLLEGDAAQVSRLAGWTRDRAPWIRDFF